MKDVEAGLTAEPSTGEKLQEPRGRRVRADCLRAFFVDPTQTHPCGDGKFGANRRTVVSATLTHPSPHPQVLATLGTAMLALVAVQASLSVVPRGVPQLARAGSAVVHRRLASHVEVKSDDGGSDGEGDDIWNQPSDRDDAAPPLDGPVTFDNCKEQFLYALEGVDAKDPKTIPPARNDIATGCVPGGRWKGGGGGGGGERMGGDCCEHRRRDARASESRFSFDRPPFISTPYRTRHIFPPHPSTPPPPLPPGATFSPWPT